MKKQLFLRRNRKHQNSLMSAVFLSVFVLFAGFFTACDKDAPMSVENQAEADKQGEQQETLPQDVKIQVVNLETA